MTVKFCDNACYVKELYSIHTNLSDFYFNTEECFYCYLTEDDKPIGFVQFKIMGLVVEILLINATSDDIKKELLTALIGFADQNHLSIEWRIISEVVGDTPLSKDFALAESFGFASTSLLHIFSSSSIVRPKALEYIKHMKTLSDYVLKRGYTFCSFSELSDDAKNYICDNPENEFADYLQSGKYIKNNSEIFCEDCSFVVLKDGKPVAYSIIRMPSNGKYIFENLCVAKNCRNSGAIAPILYSSLNALVSKDCTSVTFAVYDENAESLPLIKKHFKTLISKEKLQINYFRLHQHNDNCDCHKQ